MELQYYLHFWYLKRVLSGGFMSKPKYLFHVIDCSLKYFVMQYYNV